MSQDSILYLDPIARYSGWIVCGLGTLAVDIKLIPAIPSRIIMLRASLRPILFLDYVDDADNRYAPIAQSESGYELYRNLKHESPAISGLYRDDPPEIKSQLDFIARCLREYIKKQDRVGSGLEMRFPGISVPMSICTSRDGIQYATYFWRSQIHAGWSDSINAIRIKIPIYKNAYLQEMWLSVVEIEREGVIARSFYLGNVQIYYSWCDAILGAMSPCVARSGVEIDTSLL